MHVTQSLLPSNSFLSSFSTSVCDSSFPLSFINIWGLSWWKTIFAEEPCLPRLIAWWPDREPVIAQGFPVQGWHKSFLLMGSVSLRDSSFPLISCLYTVEVYVIIPDKNSIDASTFIPSPSLCLGDLVPWLLRSKGLQCGLAHSSWPCSIHPEKQEPSCPWSRGQVSLFIPWMSCQTQLTSLYCSLFSILFDVFFSITIRSMCFVRGQR